MIRLALIALLVFPASAAVAQKTIRALPPSMVGTWGYEGASCTDRTDDGRVRVAPRSVEFFASICRFGSFRQRPSGAVVATGRCRGEGETVLERGSFRFRLLDAERLEIAAQGTVHTYQRCLRPIAVR